jgi:hypothetical protein
MQRFRAPSNCGPAAPGTAVRRPVRFDEGGISRSAARYANSFLFCEYLTESGRVGDDMMPSGDAVASQRGIGDGIRGH